MRLILAALACWRLTSLLVYEDGPGDLFKRIRNLKWPADPDFAWIGGSTPLLHSLLDCFWCTSLWAAAPLAALAWWPDGRLMILGWLAVSTGAILVDEIISLRRDDGD